MIRTNLTSTTNIQHEKLIGYSIDIKKSYMIFYYLSLNPPCIKNAIVKSVALNRKKEKKRFCR